MNIDNGEIREFLRGDPLPDPWTPLNRAELRAVEPLPQAERPAALRAHRESRAKRRKSAAAARRRNRA